MLNGFQDTRLKNHFDKRFFYGDKNINHQK